MLPACYDPTLWVAPRAGSGVSSIAATRTLPCRVFTLVFATLLMPPLRDAIRVVYDVPFAFRLNKVTVLSTGEWLTPVTPTHKARSRVVRRFPLGATTAIHPSVTAFRPTT